MRGGAWAILALLLVSCGFLSADRAAVRTSSGKVRKAKRTQPAKKLEVHAFAAETPGLELKDYTYEESMPLAADAVDVEVHACSLGSGDVQQRSSIVVNVVGVDTILTIGCLDSFSNDLDVAICSSLEAIQKYLGGIGEELLHFDCCDT